MPGETDTYRKPVDFSNTGSDYCMRHRYCSHWKELSLPMILILTATLIMACGGQPRLGSPQAYSGPAPQDKQVAVVLSDSSEKTDSSEVEKRENLAQQDKDTAALGKKIDSTKTPDSPASELAESEPFCAAHAVRRRSDFHL